MEIGRGDERVVKSEGIERRDGMGREIRVEDRIVGSRIGHIWIADR